VRRWGGDLAHDSRVNLVTEDTRSYLRRQDEEFDLVVMPLTDSFRPVTAGAYALGEDYRYTVESLQEILNHLSEKGLVVAERWLQLAALRKASDCGPRWSRRCGAMA